MEEALDAGKPEDFADHAERYAAMLVDHIAKEDEVLFVMAEGFLNSQDDESILHRFDEIEREMGEDTHDRFHDMLRALERRCLMRAAV